MAEFLEDPSVLTKDKLKSELLANDVPLPSGEHRKDVYVQLYLKHLTALNKKNSPADTFSSDEEITPVISNRSRSGKVSEIYNSNNSKNKTAECSFHQLTLLVCDLNLQKATRKTDKTRKEEVDVVNLSDSDLKDQLLKYGINPGPIVGKFTALH